MRKWLYTLTTMLLLAWLPAGAGAQGRGRALRPPPRMGPAQMNRRTQLERQILRRFVQQSGREMKLSSDTQNRLEKILNDSNDRRRDLVQRSMEVRRRLAQASRDPRTSDADLHAITSEVEALRQREQEQWRRDQDALATTLTPQQRAQFMLRWTRFQERIRQMATRAGALDSLPDTTR